MNRESTLYFWTLRQYVRAAVMLEGVRALPDLSQPATSAMRAVQDAYVDRFDDANPDHARIWLADALGRPTPPPPPDEEISRKIRRLYYDAARECLA